MPTDDQMRWVAHGERSLYESDWVRLRLVDVTTPSGSRFEHHVVRMNRVVVSLVVRECRVLMVRRHRFVDDSWGWELPAGIVEPGETAVDAAVRETREETGWAAQHASEVLRFQPAIGIADSQHVVVLSRGASQVGPPTDADEAGELAWFDRPELTSRLTSGDIRDGASLVGVLHALALPEAGL